MLDDMGEGEMLYLAPLFPGLTSEKVCATVIEIKDDLWQFRLDFFGCSIGWVHVARLGDSFKVGVTSPEITLPSNSYIATPHAEPNLPLALYPIASALQVDLEREGPIWRGNATRKVKIGLWDLNFNVQVTSDFASDDRAGCWVRFTDRLHGYIACTKGLLLLVLFDVTKMANTQPTGNLLASLDKTKKAQLAAFSFNHATQAWTRADAHDLVKRPTPKNPQGSRSRTVTR